MHGEFAQLSYFGSVLTAYELQRCFDIKKLPPIIGCNKRAVAKYQLDERHQVSDCLGGIVWKPYGMAAINDKLTIRNNIFRGTSDKRWAFGITWRIGMGGKPGDYHIVDLPTG